MPRNLSAEISADASDFISSVEAAADRSDNLGDQASQASERVERLGDKATTTATSVGALGAVVTTTSGAMSGLALATSASLVPALGALSATAVPLTATLGGLATAAGGVAAGFGAVIGTGLLAFGEEAAEQNEKRLRQINEKIEQLEKLKESTDGLTESQQKQLRTLKKQQKEVKQSTTVTGALADELEPAKEQFRESALALGQEFIPLIRDAIDALPAFIRQIEGAIGDLTPFAAALRDAGQAAFEVVPKMVDQIMDMGRDALPAVRNLGGAIADNAVPALQAMADTTSTVIEIFDGFGTSIGGLLPKINKLGIEVLQEVVPALQTVGSAAGDVISKFNDLTTAQQGTAAKAALVAPAIGAIATRLGAINPVLGAVAGAVGALGLAWTENVGDIRTKTNQLVSDNTKYESVSDAVRGMTDTVVSAFNDATDALTDFISENETAQSAIGSTVDGFRDASESLKSIADGQFKDAIKDFESATKSLIDTQETILVGSSGDDGLVGVFDQALTDVQTYLQEDGTEMTREGTGSIIDVIVAEFESLTKVLLGSDGAGGVLGTLADQLSTYLSETLPKMTGKAAEAVGRAIRDGILDLLKPLSGEDSQILDALADVATFLITKVPKLFVAVGQSVVKSIIKGVKGLFRGLVGNSVLKDQIIRAADFLVRNMGTYMRAVGGAIVDVIVSGVSGLFKLLVGDSGKLITKISQAGTQLIKNMGSVLGDVGGAIVDEILGSISGLASGIKDKLRDAVNTAIRGLNDLVPSSVNVPKIGPFGGHSIDTGPVGKVPGLPETVRFPQFGPFGGGRINVPGFPIDTLDGGDDDDGPQLPPYIGAETGGFIESGGLLNVHEGERVVPAAQVNDRGPAPIETGGMNVTIETINASGRREGREAGKALRQELNRFNIG